MSSESPQLLLNASTQQSNNNALPLTSGHTHSNNLSSLYVTIYSIFRIIILFIQNIYQIPGYLILTWIILLPLYYIKPSLYWIIENNLYNWLLYTVSSWSWLANIQVLECGDDFHHMKIRKTEKKVPTKATNGHYNNNQRNQESPKVLPNDTVPAMVSNGTNNKPNNESKQVSQDIKKGYLETNGGSSGLKNETNYPPKILLVTNHQSTADVPLMMQAFTANPYILLWVIDKSFFYTNFGLVSSTHGDFFLNTRSFKKGELRSHCLEYPDKNCLILFPEGGFRYKRIQASNKYADKQGWSHLKNVTWPRYGAFNDISIDPIGITHLVDLTILYPDINDAISILDIAKGIKACDVIFHYKIYDLTDIEGGINEEWLRKLWIDKETLMERYYQNKEAFLRWAGETRKIQLNWIKLVWVNVFYFIVCLWFISVVKLISQYLVHH